MAGPRRNGSSKGGPSRGGPGRGGAGKGGPSKGGPGQRGADKRGASGGRAGRTDGGRPSGGRPGGRAGAGGRGAPRPGSAPRSREGGAPARAGRSAPRGLGGQQIEGRQAVRELLLAQRRSVHEVVMDAELEGDPAVLDLVELAAAARAPVRYVARRRFEDLSRSEAPQGVLATAAPVPEAELEDIIAGRGDEPAFVVAVDGVTDPGNLGAILRSCEGAGVHGVVLPRHRAVHVTPTVAKAAAGAVEHVPIALVGGLPAALAQLRSAGVWIVGLDDAAERTVFDLGDLAREPVCLVLGAEGAGLSRLVRERCDLVVQIPMRGRLSSLNVSAAAALATYEVTRQRLAGPAGSADAPSGPHR